MARRRPSRALFLLGALLLADSAAATQTDEYQCRREGMVRRVQLGGGPAGEPLPCEVVYWKETEEPGRGLVLWHAATDRRYCEAKASAFIEQLRGWGWRCERLGVEVEERLERPAAMLPPRIKPGPRRPHAAKPGDATALAMALDGTLASLGKLRPGVFEGEVADHGDLNGDGFEDAVVIITYRAGDGGTVRYLVAYLFDGDGYRSTSARHLGGPDEPQQGEVEQIVDGEILVKPRPGVEAAAWSRPAAFVLQEGRLVPRE